MTSVALIESLDFTLSSRDGFRLPSGAFLPTGGEFRVHSKTDSAVHGADCLLECGIERNCAFIPRREKETSVSDEHRLQAAAEQMCKQTESTTDETMLAVSYKTHS